jgi:uncharacterized protein
MIYLMKDYNILTLFLNKPFLGAIIAQLSAQGVKPIVNLIRYKKFDLKKAFEYGNFPSGHTAFIVGVTAGAGLAHGFNSTYFAIAVVVAAIMIYDIIKMRKTVEVCIEAVKELGEKEMVSLPAKVPQFKGHSVLEVAAGALWGILWAVVVHVY